MKRSEAVALLKELGKEGLIQPSLVLIEQRQPGNYQLCIKGDYDRSQIIDFLKKHTLECDENTKKGYFCMF